MALLLSVMIIFTMVMIPNLDANADTDSSGIVLMKDVVESSVDDVTYVHYLYSPSADHTKVEATIKASNGQSRTTSLYAYGKSDFCYFKVTIYVKGTYTLDLVEYKESGGSWTKTGKTAKATIKVSARKTGWSQTNGDWCYYDSNGKRLYGWQKISGKWYYLDDFFGAAQTGWLKLDGKWYYFDKNGVAVTGWNKIDGKYYHFTGGCVMDTGWKKIDGKWYYFGTDGVMRTHWQEIDGTYYYFGGSGQMTTGWKQIGKNWYYFSKGAMTVGWLHINNDGWYYFNKDGVMQSGWKKISGKQYYFKNGKMVTGKQTIDGKTYTFDKNGVLKK